MTATQAMGIHRGQVSCSCSTWLAEAAPAGPDAAIGELHHRIGNDLQVIICLAEMEARRCRNPRGKAALERLSLHVTSLGQLYSHMRADGPNSVNFTDYLVDLCHKLAATLETEFCSIRVVVDPKPVQVEAGRASYLAVVVKELVSNAARHAFPPGVAGAITIRLLQCRLGTIALSVSDDGCGFKGSRGGGEGLGIVQGLVRAAEAEVTRTNGVGTTWTIRFAA